jgi:NDP-sugar pyrophosphorylase family protein
MLKTADLFDLSQTQHAALFDGCDYAWEALAKIQDYVTQHPRQQPPKRFPGALIGDKVFLGEGTVVEAGAMIKGPAIIGKNCQIRHNAYIRENVIVGDDCVVGNACELKNTILFNGAQVPHFNYLGDSILGHKAHVGAGVICSNLKSLPGNVTVQSPKSKVQSPETLDVGLETLDTGLRKFGALIGDGAEVGCNSVLNPGSIIGRGAVIYPGVNWRGVLPANSIAKNKTQPEVVVRKAE